MGWGGPGWDGIGTEFEPGLAYVARPCLQNKEPRSWEVIVNYKTCMTVGRDGLPVFLILRTIIKPERVRCSRPAYTLNGGLVHLKDS